MMMRTTRRSKPTTARNNRPAMTESNQREKQTRSHEVQDISSEETDILLTSIQEVLPIGPLDWEKVVQMHTDQFPEMGRDLQSVRRKFNKLQASRVPTGDPNCPPAVRTAKRIQREIEEKMDAEEEVAEQELGFPDNKNESTNPSANPSTPLFRQPKRARVTQPEPVSSKMDGIMSILVTKMVRLCRCYLQMI